VASGDPETYRIRRAFEAARLRMCQLADPDCLPDELSNMLHHHYRLGELRRRRWRLTNTRTDKKAFDARVQAVPGALGAMWIRSYDTHDAELVVEVGGLFSNYMTNLFGVLVWQPRSALPFTAPDGDGRYRDYDAALDGRPVLDSLSRAFDGLAALP
jgi:hypothetical protein